MMSCSRLFFCLFTIVAVFSSLPFVRALHDGIRRDPGDKATILSEKEGSRNLWSLGKYECSKVSSLSTGDRTMKMCRKSCKAKKNCEEYEFLWKLKRCRMFLKGQGGEEEDKVIKCTRKGTASLFPNASTNKFTCKSFGTEEIFSSVKSVKDCKKKCNKQNCLTFEYNKSTEDCKTIVSGVSGGTCEKIISPTCRCATQNRLNGVVNGILDGTYEYFEEASCDLDNQGALYLYYKSKTNYYGEDEEWPLLGYGAIVTDDESSCLEGGDALRLIPRDEAAECYQSIKESCSKIQEQRKQCPCYNSGTVDNLTSKILEGSYDYDNYSSCKLGPGDVTISINVLETQNQEQIGFGASKQFCQQDDLVFPVTSDQAEDCYGIVKEACEKIQANIPVKCPCFTSNTLTRFVNRINVDGSIFDYDSKISCNFENPNSLKIFAAVKGYNWPMAYGTNKSDVYGNECLMEGDIMVGGLSDEEADKCIALLTDACALIEG